MRYLYNHQLMLERAKFNRIIHWIVIFTVLFSSFAPSLSRALAASRNDTNTMGYGYVCTVSGMKSIANSSDLPSDQGGDQKLSIDDSCGYCTLQGNYFAPASSESYFLPINLADHIPALFYKSPKPLFAWIKLPSQAPPLIA